MFGIIEDGTYRVETIGFSIPELTTGYVVALQAIRREADIPNLGTLFGRWTDTDGTVYWDEVEVFEDETEALLTAASRGELAIWDIARGVEIRVETRVVGSLAWYGHFEVKTSTGWMAF